MSAKRVVWERPRSGSCSATRVYEDGTTDFVDERGNVREPGETYKAMAKELARLKNQYEPPKPEVIFTAECLELPGYSRIVRQYMSDGTTNATTDGIPVRDNDWLHCKVAAELARLYRRVKELEKTHGD